MVPKGWTAGQLSDVCRLQNGYGFTPPVWDTHGLPIIRIQNLNGSKSFNYFSGEPNPKWLVEHGQMLFAWAGSKGASFGPTIWRGETGVLNQHIFKVFEAEGVDHSWLFLIMRQITDRIEAKAHGFKATLVHVKKSDIENQPIHIPPLPEQRKIADILATWDKAIEKTEALLTNARTQKRALMQQLLTGKRRFPEFKSQPWKEVRFGDVVRVSKHRLDPKREHDARKCIEMEHIEAETGRLIGSTTSDRQASTKAVFGPGDILYGKLRPYLRKFHAPDFEGVCSTEIWVLQPNISELYSPYLYSLVQSEGFQEQTDKSAGSKMPRADWKIVSEYRFLLPSLPEQQAISSLIEDLGKEIDIRSDSIVKLRTEKKALMQQLLTGKRRVKVECDYGV